MKRFPRNLLACLGRSTALVATAGLLAVLSLAAPAFAQEESTPPPSTNLGVLVVTPILPATSPSATKASTIQRGALDLKLKISPPRITMPPVHDMPPVSAGKPTPRTPASAVHIVSPQYPSAALAQNLRGSVTLRFTILPNGRTGQIRILSSTPRHVFDESAEDAVSQWRFRPATENGRPVATAVTQTLVFNPPLRRQTLPEPPPRPTPAQVKSPPASPPQSRAATTDKAQARIEPISIVSPRYPPKAYRRGIGGHVTVQFTIGTDGHTRHIRVLDAEPRGVFNDAARRAVSQWRFKPVAEPVVLTQTITFTPPQG